MFALMLATIGLSAPAATAATAAEGSLTVTYQYQEAVLNNADINLYRLADWSAKGGYTPTGDFADHGKYCRLGYSQRRPANPARLRQHHGRLHRSEQARRGKHAQNR